MLYVSADLSGYALAAGEPFLFDVQWQDGNGLAQDLSARAFLLSFHGPDRTVIETIVPERLRDSTGAFLRFARDGRLSEALYGRSVRVELAERYRNGRTIWASGVLTVAPSSAGTATFEGDGSAQFAVRATLRADAARSGAWTSAIRILPYAERSETAPLVVALLGGSSPERYASAGMVVADPRIRILDPASGTFAPMTQGVFCATMGAVLLDQLGCGLDIVPAGVGGSTLAGWDSDPRHIATLAERVARAGGSVDYLLMQIGGNDVANGMVTSIEAQMARIRSVIAKARAAIGLPHCPVLLNPTQDYADRPGALAIQRQAEIRVATTDAHVGFGISVHDIATSDGVHQRDPDGYAVSGTRMGRRLAALVAGRPDQRGPSLSAASPVSATQSDVTIAHRLGDDITPRSGIAGFVLRGGSGAAIAIASAERLSGNVVRLTHAARVPGEAAAVLYMPNGGNADDDAVLRDTSAGAWPMESSGWPIALAALADDMAGTPTYRATGKRAQIDYGPSDNPACAGWNNRPFAGIQAAAALLDPGGAALGWTDRETTGIPSGSTGGSGNLGATTGDDSGVYPDSVMAGYISHPDTGTAIQAIGGLDDGKAYDITLFVSRKAADRSTLFTIGGAARTLSASNSEGETANAGNIRTTVTFAKVRPTGGVIQIGWAMGTVNGVKSSFAYLGAMVVTEYGMT